ncbi:hypothetical protein [Actinoplanes sp. NPDC049802]|uniref:hypothetical protein n=1 Tax=Actinoplanes sp. NPDC049802 TaxID=3154742 RepID=UPI0033C55122
MAVLIDITAFLESLPADVAEAADRLLDDGAVGDVESVGGGARALVADGATTYQPWVGVVDREITGDCDCGGPAGLCSHAVAVAVVALDAQVRFAAEGDPHGAGQSDPDRARLRRAVAALGPRQLHELVVDQALRDRRFAALLLGRAGLLDTAGESAVAAFKTAVRAASNVTVGNRWEIVDVENAGRDLATEAEILLAHPAELGMLDLIEEAVEVWDGLVPVLDDAWEVRRSDPEEISEVLLEAHRDLCDRLDLDPGEVTDRLARLSDACSDVEIPGEW